MPVIPNPARHPQSNTPLALGSREALVSALQPSTGSGDMQSVTLPKAPSPPLPAGVSGPWRRDLAEGLCPVMAPVPRQYLRRGLTMAATTAPSAGKGPPGCRVLWNSRQGGTLSTVTFGAPTPWHGGEPGEQGGGFTAMLREAPLGRVLAMGHGHPTVPRGVEGTRRGAPGSHLGWPHPPPRQCFWAAAPGGTSPAWLGSAPSCQAEAAAEPAPPQTTPPGGTPIQHRGAPRWWQLQGCPVPPKTHSLPLQLGQRLLLG